MQTIWHRATETIETEAGKDVPRPFLYPTPVLREDLSGYLSYPLKHDEIAVSLVITRLRSRSRSDYPELLMKQAVWMVKHLCEYTDIVETGTRLRLSISSGMRDVAMPYLEECDYPLDTIYWFESREAQYKHISKFDAMHHPDFAGVTRLLHFDVAQMIGAHPTQRNFPLVANVLNRWKDQPMAVLRLYQREDEPLLNKMAIRDDDPYQEHITQIVEAASKLSGNSFEQERAYWESQDPMWDVLGGLLGITRELLDDPYFNEVFMAISSQGADERALMVYCRLMGWTEADVAILFGFTRSLTEELYMVRGLNFAWSGMDPDLWLKQHKQYKRNDDL